MKRLALLLILFVGCTRMEPTRLYLIGTVHDSTEYINSGTLYATLERLAPEVILCELELQFFTPAGSYDLVTYPNLLSTNENIATYRYQQTHGTPLCPYEIEGRNEHYRTSGFFDKQQHIFSEMMAAYRDSTMSRRSMEEWKRFLQTIPQLDIPRDATLALINSELYVRYSQAKELITYNTLISIADRDFPQWSDAARMINKFTETRNRAMAENIRRQCRRFEGKTVVVLCGQQHKAPLEDILKNSSGDELKIVFPQPDVFDSTE